MAADIEFLKQEICNLKTSQLAATKQKKTVSFTDAVISDPAPKKNDELVRKSPLTTVCERPVTRKSARKSESKSSAVTTFSDNPTPNPKVAGAISADVINDSNPVNKSTEEDNDGFTRVIHKRNRRPPLTRGTSKKICSLSGIPKRSHIHIWNLPPNTTCDSVLQYIKEQKHEVTESSIEIEQLKVTRGDYASFRISVGKELGDELLSSEFWHEDVCFGTFFFPKLRQNTLPG
jgi:hypothetical protein